MISASSALVVIWLPQVGPTKLGVIFEAGMLNRCSIASAIFTVRLTGEVGSALVVTSHCDLSSGELAIWTVASPPPLAFTSSEIWPWTAVWLPWLVVYGNWKVEPPLKSTEKFSPFTSSATTHTSRMRPEMAYHIR